MFLIFNTNTKNISITLSQNLCFMPNTKKDIIAKLQKNILQWQGFTPPATGHDDKIGLGSIEAAFPNGIFPKGAIHEFLSTEPEHAAACGGFISGLLQKLMQHQGVCIWISTVRTLFPPALTSFGVEPDRIIFIDLKQEKDVLWAMEEALKCEGLAAVIAEIQTINFIQSRRLQLAVEQSKVTGLLLRTNPKGLTANACVARWQITHLPSETEDALPGLGYPRWNVVLLKVRNGNPGSWNMEWTAGTFKHLPEQIGVAQAPYHTQKTG